MLPLGVGCAESLTTRMDKARVVCECDTVDDDFFAAAGVALGSGHV